jgi:hypothetical protein
MQRLRPTFDPEAVAEAEAQAKRAQTERKALASVKPFLLALFDDLPGSVYYNEALQAEETRQEQEEFRVTSRSFVPTGDYEESLKREMQKPYRLNFVPSTDRLPLNTKTVATTFTRYPETGDPTEHFMMLARPKRKVTSGPGADLQSNSPRRMLQTQSTSEAGGGANGSSSPQSFSRTGMADTSSASGLPAFLQGDYSRRLQDANSTDFYTPYHGALHNEERLLKESHLNSLLLTIEESKQVPKERPPVVWW